MAVEEYITLGEAAERAGYAQPDSLRQAVLRGSLQAKKLGRNWFTTEEWLDDYIQQRTTRRDERPIRQPGQQPATPVL